MDKPNFQLRLKGRTMVLVDWANIRNQQKKLGWEIDLKKLYYWANDFEAVDTVKFFYGFEKKRPTSIKFLKKVGSFGFEIFEKEVKYLKNSKGRLLPKCDFDTEIACEMVLSRHKYRNFILFSGDGDFKYPIEKVLEIGKKKHIFIMSERPAVGREIWTLRKEFPKNIAIVTISKLKETLQ